MLIKTVLINLILLSTLLAQPDVIVQDVNGQPIKNAIITPMSMSMNYGKIKTNEKGEATFPAVIQKIKWIKVEKAGYITTGHIPVSPKKTAMVKLKKKP